MQPLDAAAFGPLKCTWQEVCHNYIQSHPGRIITKYHFNEIFSMAWSKGLVPASVFSGFKTCGIYPFDPKAVLHHDPCDSTTASILLQSNTENSDSVIAQAVFTEEEEICFVRRYSEGYDLAPDPRYLQWLQLNHPEENGRSISDYFSDVPPTEPLQLSTAADMSPSHTFVSKSEHINVPCADHTPNVSHSNVSCGSTDVTPGLTPTRVFHISTQPISSLANANKPVSLPQYSTSTNATPHLVVPLTIVKLLSVIHSLCHLVHLLLVLFQST